MLWKRALRDYLTGNIAAIHTPSSDFCFKISLTFHSSTSGLTNHEKTQALSFHKSSSVNYYASDYSLRSPVWPFTCPYGFATYSLGWEYMSQRFYTMDNYFEYDLLVDVKWIKKTTQCCICTWLSYSISCESLVIVYTKTSIGCLVLTMLTEICRERFSK